MADADAFIAAVLQFYETPPPPDLPRISGLDIRERWAATAEVLNLGAPDRPVERGVAIASRDGRALTADLYPPDGAGPHPALLFAHGGSWVAGSPRTHDKLARRLAERGFLVVSVDYALAPEHPHPAGLDDCVAAADWLAAEAEALGADRARQAINVGDFLFTRALRALSGAGAPPERRVAALDALLAAIEDMIGGQWADLSFEPRGDVSAAEYLDMVEGKTGALIGAPLQIGAILAGAPVALGDGIRDWGRKVGLAFQARDDVLGIWGDPSLTGKSNRNDLARRKKTLPVIEALADPRTRDAVERLHALDEPPDDAIAALADRLEAAGARARAEEHARRYVAEADGLLDALGLRDDERAVFAAVARYLIERAG